MLKTVREWCFALQKMCHDEEVEQLKKKVRELQDSCERWKKLYFDLERKFEEGRRQDSKAVSTRPVVGTSTAATNQVPQ
jgi:predicted RNase H-like nuclease (RuvC/YqgF family)